MSNVPMISIITPVYNVEQYLPQCIESIIAQTLQNWELILINDGSKDRSGIICDKYAAIDSRIRVLHKENSGQADSRNIALSMANANLIGFVDSDDWIEPDMYELLYRTMMDSQADISICSYFRDGYYSSIPSCNEGDLLVYSCDEAMVLLWEDNIIKSYLWDKLFRKEMITTLLPKGYYYEDYSILPKWFLNANVVAFARSPKYHYRFREASTCNDKDPMKSYHFVVAGIERYNGFITNPLFYVQKERLACKVVKNSLKEAKNISKFSGEYSLAISYLRLIKQVLMPLNSIRMRQLGFNAYLKKLMLFYFPAFFYHQVQIEYKLKRVIKRICC